ncbi:hypothetical protein HPB52_007876 [Rhipicephalus sanguineus]|uniref:Uncharacterized protein n=1 Tax=Rhipicephalus sanguineus TaxID=34632 RepID=A0A9D4T8Y6_RHISA|nr:hypothetical protein HPB52_007876 [Rhipicephalus sanguineus]
MDGRHRQQCDVDNGSVSAHIRCLDAGAWTMRTWANKKGKDGTANGQKKKRAPFLPAGRSAIPPLKRDPSFADRHRRY